MDRNIILYISCQQRFSATLSGPVSSWHSKWQHGEDSGKQLVTSPKILQILIDSKWQLACDWLILWSCDLQQQQLQALLQALGFQSTTGTLFSSGSNNHGNPQYVKRIFNSVIRSKSYVDGKLIVLAQ